MKWPRRCTRSTRSHSCADIVKTIRSRSTPSLLTTMSSPPNEPRAAASIASPAAQSPTSPSLATARPPAAVISSATACTASPGRSFSTTPAPAAARAIASARPRPWPAPVTIAVLPSRVSPSAMLTCLLFSPVAFWPVARLPARRPALSRSVTGSGQDPAVGHELAAGAVRRLVRGQERDQSRDLDRLAEPAERQRLEIPFAALGVHRLRVLEHHPGEDPARVHRVDPDAEPAEFLRRRVGHAADRELVRRVGRAAGRAGQSLDRGDVHDRPAAGRLHRLDHGLHAQPAADRVDVKYPAELGQRHLADRAERQHPGIVDADVEPAEGLDGQADRGGPVLLAGHIVVYVPAGAGAELAGDGLPPLVEHFAEDDLRALGGEVPHVRLAHAPGAARDQRDLAVESAHAVRSWGPSAVSAEIPVPTRVQVTKRLLGWTLLLGG